MALLGVRDVVQNGRRLEIYKKKLDKLRKLLGSVTSSKINAILNFTKKKLGKLRKLQTFFARVEKYDTIKQFASFGRNLHVFTPKR